MLNTLALFLSPKERKMSRIVPQSKSEGKRYIPNLYLQGYVKKVAVINIIIIIIIIVVVVVVIIIA